MEAVSNLPAGVVLELASPSVTDELVERVFAGEVAPKVSAIRRERSTLGAADRSYSVGGTFIDYVAIDGDGRLRTHKHLSDPSNLADAFLDGLRVAAPAGTRRLVHGTTVATNALLERRGAATGLLTTLLPCGWLYAFVITAAGTGNALAGAGLMATFWVGTLPMLTIVGIGVRKLAAPLAAKWAALV